MHLHRDMVRFRTLGSVTDSKRLRERLVEIVAVMVEASVLGKRLQSRLYLSFFEHFRQAAGPYAHLHHLVCHVRRITHHGRTAVHVCLLRSLLQLVLLLWVD